ncbi:MAG: hypothetical protein AAF316_03245 [Cyanobacteria bacterium P01_A01_bin.80]
MTQKLPGEKLVSGLLQSIDPQQIADEGVRQTVEVLLNGWRATKLQGQTIRRRKPKATG